MPAATCSTGSISTVRSPRWSTPATARSCAVGRTPTSPASSRRTPSRSARQITARPSGGGACGRAVDVVRGRSEQLVVGPASAHDVESNDSRGVVVVSVITEVLVCVAVVLGLVLGIVDAVVVSVLLAVLDTVVIGVGVRGVGRHAAVLDLVAVVDAVVVGVGVVGAGAVAELAEVAQPVAVGVALGVGVVGVEVVAQLPPVGHAVAVGVAYAVVPGGVHSGG